jgi:rRNA-processing protein FCF1
MELVVDNNVLFALPRSSRVRKLVDKLLERKVRLLIPQFVIDELVALKGDVMK